MKIIKKETSTYKINLLQRGIMIEKYINIWSTLKSQKHRISGTWMKNAWSKMNKQCKWLVFY